MGFIRSIKSGIRDVGGGVSDIFKTNTNIHSPVSLKKLGKPFRGMFHSKPSTISQPPLPQDLRQTQGSARDIQQIELDRLRDLGAGTNIDQLVELSGRKQLAEQRMSQEPILAELRSRELEATSGVDDARRALRARIAQRGLGSSSIGLAQEQSLQRKQREELQNIGAQRESLARQRQIGSEIMNLTIPERTNEMVLQGIQQRAGITNQILGAPGVLPDTVVNQGKPSVMSQLLGLGGESAKTYGLLKLLGAV